MDKKDKISVMSNMDWTFFLGLLIGIFVGMMLMLGIGLWVI